MKKVITIICTVLLIFTLFSCVSYEEIKPNESDYATWDGNYIYYGNKRCKTTGEKEETLIEYVDYEEVRYYIEDTIDFCYIDNVIYFIFSANTNNDLEEFDSTLFVKYIIKTKNYEVLGVGDKTSYNCIEKKFDDFIYLEVNKGTISSDYLIYDIKNNKSTILSDVTKITFVGDYVVIHIEGMVRVSKYNEFNFVTIDKINKGVTKYSYLEHNNKEYIAITINNYDTKDLDNNSYKIYDITTKKLHTIVSEDDKKHVEIINDEYFILFTGKDMDYLYGDGCKKEKYDYFLKAENILCKFNFEKMDYEVVYEFEKANYDYTNGFILDGSYYTEATFVKRGWFIFKGDIKTKNYQLILENNGFRKIKTLPDKPKEDFVDEYRVVYKNLEYYVKTVSYGGILANLSANYLYCYNNETQETTLLQFYTEGSLEDGRYAKSLFNSDIVFNIDNILILSY